MTCQSHGPDTPTAKEQVLAELRSQLEVVTADCRNTNLEIARLTEIKRLLEKRFGEISSAIRALERL